MLPYLDLCRAAWRRADAADPGAPPLSAAGLCSRKHKWIDRLHDTKSGVPYGITLAIAGLLVYPETAIFTHFIG